MTFTRVVVVDLENMMPSAEKWPADYRYSWLVSNRQQVHAYFDHLMSGSTAPTGDPAAPRDSTGQPLWIHDPQCDHSTTATPGTGCTHSRCATCSCTVTAHSHSQSNNALLTDLLDADRHGNCESAAHQVCAPVSGWIALSSDRHIPRPDARSPYRAMLEAAGFGDANGSNTWGFGAVPRIYNTVGDDHADQLAALAYDLIRQLIAPDSECELVVMTGDGRRRGRTLPEGSPAKENSWIRVMADHYQQGRGKVTVMPFCSWNGSGVSSRYRELGYDGDHAASAATAYPPGDAFWKKLRQNISPLVLEVPKAAVRNRTQVGDGDIGEISRLVSVLHSWGGAPHPLDNDVRGLVQLPHKRHGGCPWQNCPLVLAGPDVAPSITGNTTIGLPPVLLGHLVAGFVLRKTKAHPETSADYFRELGQMTIWVSNKPEAARECAARILRGVQAGDHPHLHH